MIGLAAAILQVGITALGSAEVGRRLLGGRALAEDPLLRRVAETAIGLAVVSWAVFLLVTLGLLSVASLWGLGVVVGIAAILGVLPREPRVALGLPGWFVGPLVLWSAWVAFVAALPPTGIDELIYHLEVPRRMLAAGGMPRFTDNIYAYFPQGADQLLLFGLGVGGEAAARLMHGLFGLLTALAIFGAARPLAGERGAAVGALAFLTVPTVLVIAGWAYVDLYFTLYAFLAVLLVLRTIECRSAGASAMAPAALAGVMAGTAWTAKYTGLQLTLLLVLLLLVDHLLSRRRRAPIEVLPLGAIALALVAPFLLRNLWLTGWPLFPFAALPLPLQEGINWDPDRARLFVAWLSSFGGEAERGLLERAMAPVTVHVQGRFGDLTAFDGRAGLVFLLAPLALWRERRLAVRLLGGFWLAYALYWSMTTTQVRFLLPALPAAAVLLAVAVARNGRWLTAAAGVLIAVATAAGVGEALRADPFAWWSGREGRDAYMSRNVAGYGLYRIAGERLRPGERLYLVNMRHFGYLLDLPEAPGATTFPSAWRADYVFQQYSLGEVLAQAASIDDVAAFFQQLGVTHVMIDQALTFAPGALDSGQRQLLVQFLRRWAVAQASDPRSPEMTLWRLRATAVDGEAGR